MTVQIALLRAVNVAAYGTVKMADLKAVITKLGFTNVETLLQSGNVVFRSGGATGKALETMLEAEVAKRLGLKTDFMVRSAKEWAGVVAANPFPEAARDDPSRLLVMFLKDAARPKAVEALKAAIKGRETIAAKGRELYAIYPDGTGRSKLTNALIEGKVGTRATGRNWNTVMRIKGMVME